MFITALLLIRQGQGNSGLEIRGFVKLTLCIVFFAIVLKVGRENLNIYSQKRMYIGSNVGRVWIVFQHVALFKYQNHPIQIHHHPPSQSKCFNWTRIEASGFVNKGEIRLDNRVRCSSRTVTGVKPDRAEEQEHPVYLPLVYVPN